MAKIGYDLSAHQGKFDLSLLKEAQFVILRAGYAGWGNPSVSYKDEQFENYYAQAKKLGLAVGAYFYAPSLTINQARKEAEAFVAYLKGKQFELPVYMDVEDTHNGQMALSSKQITEMVKAFCDIMEQNGYFAGVYSTQFFLENKIKTDAYTKWVAAWQANSGHLEKRLEQYPLHQFTSMARVNGFRLDQDILYDEKLLSLIKDNGFNGYGKIKVKTYVVKKGDTLIGIAQKYGTTYKKLAQENQIENVDLIYPGQVIKIV